VGGRRSKGTKIRRENEKCPRLKKKGKRKEREKKNQELGAQCPRPVHLAKLVEKVFEFVENAMRELIKKGSRRVVGGGERQTHQSPKPGAIRSERATGLKKQEGSSQGKGKKAERSNLATKDVRRGAGKEDALTRQTIRVPSLERKKERRGKIFTSAKKK